MVKKCIYCGAEVPDKSIVDFCERCGKNVFGEKMFNAIVQNMENARANGDLCHDNMLTEIPRETEEFEKF